MKQQFLIVGNATCRRVGFWQAALARRHWPAAIIVTYKDLLTGRTRLGQHLSSNTLLRLESAAENWDTFKLLLKHGIAPALQEGYPALDETEIERLEYERGWLVKARQCYLGFTRLLQTLTQEVTTGHAEALNHADDIAVLFDKPVCQERLACAEIPIPLSLGSARTYAEIRERHRQVGRVMVKLAHGSGAAGCVALHWSGGRVQALTTVVKTVSRGRDRLYCSKRTQVLHNEIEIADLVDSLCVERVQVEQWLPKARWDGHNFDLRVVTIGGVPRHTLARISHSIFTNLTLGNRRGDAAAIARRMGPLAWQRLRDTCTRVAAVFPHSFTLGLDVLVRPDFQTHVVLEVNAFGDLLLNQLDRDGDTYTATLSAWERGRRRPGKVGPVHEHERNGRPRRFAAAHS